MLSSFLRRLREVLMMLLWLLGELPNRVRLFLEEELLKWNFPSYFDWSLERLKEKNIWLCMLMLRLLRSFQDVWLKMEDCQSMMFWINFEGFMLKKMMDNYGGLMSLMMLILYRILIRTLFGNLCWLNKITLKLLMS